MKATVIKLNTSLPTCSARTKNDLLVVFRPPANALIDLDDVLDFDLQTLDQVQSVENLTKRQRIDLEVRSNDLHDLRLPSSHGTSRFPSDERRNEA